MDAIELIARKRMELDAERVQLLKRLSEIDKEVADQDTAIRVVKSVMGQVVSAGEAIQDQADTPMPIRTNPLGYRVKDVAIAVLKDAYPNSMNAADIRKAALEKYGIEINSNTLTVSLSRWKTDGRVMIVGREWSYLPKAAEIMEAQKERAAGDLLSRATPTAPNEASNDAVKRGEVVHDIMS